MVVRAFTAVAVLLISLFTSFDRSFEKASAKDTMLVQIDKLLIAEETRSIVLLLKPVSSDEKATGDPRVLPLIIGLEEGRSIGIAFHKMPMPRPLSHDLMKTIIQEYQGSVDHCIITKMERETFFAELHLKRDGKDLTIDCRPSDAIALSIRAGTPVFVRRDVFEKLAVDPSKPGATKSGPTA
jgi:bifunctional DNase/RNase